MRRYLDGCFYLLFWVVGMWSAGDGHVVGLKVLYISPSPAYHFGSIWRARLSTPKCVKLRRAVGLVDT